VTAALGWIRRHWTFDENPGLGQQGLYYYLHAMARALRASGIDVITTADGSTPLFTDGDGTRASFFAERRDAEAKLKSLKGAGDATVMSLPLSEALDLKKQPASELGGEFTLSARKGERDDASAIAGAQADPDDLPLFFDPRLAAPSGEVYLFLKKGDVDKSWAKAVGGKPSAKTGFPQYQTTSVRALEGGKQGGPKFIIVSSEKF